MKRWVLGLFFIIMVAILLGACAENKSKEDRNLKLGLMPDIGMLPLLVADEEGYFTDHKLNVELIVFKSAKDRDAALQGGQLDGTMSDLLAVYFLNNNDIPVKATTITESRFLLLSSGNSGITKLTELQDVEIGLSVNTVIEYFVDSLLAKNGVHAKNTSVPQIPVRMELLRTGQLKAASMPDPLATVVIKSGANILADSRNLDMDPAVLIFTEKTIEEQENALKDFFKAYNKAVTAINTQPEKYRHLLLDKGGFPENVINEIKIPTFRFATDPTQKEVQQILEWVQEKGLKKKDLNYPDLVKTGLFE